jgi:hypothetical protein
MQRFLPIFLILVAIAVWLKMKSPSSSSNTIEYQGQQVKLSKPYDDYDDYKNDPSNLPPDEVAKVRRLVQSAPIASRFVNREQMIHAVFELQFPGYGLTACGERSQPDGSVLALFGVEIPKSDQTRYLLFRGNNSAYTLIDDFVYSDATPIGEVGPSGDQFVYSTRQGGVKVVERKPSVK